VKGPVAHVRPGPCPQRPASSRRAAAARRRADPGVPLRGSEAVAHFKPLGSRAARCRSRAGAHGAPRLTASGTARTARQHIGGRRAECGARCLRSCQCPPRPAQRATAGAHRATPEWSPRVSDRRPRGTGSPLGSPASIPRPCHPGTVGRRRYEPSAITSSMSECAHSEELKSPRSRPRRSSARGPGCPTSPIPVRRQAVRRTRQASACALSSARRSAAARPSSMSKMLRRALKPPTQK